jgi:uncharacterized membrane protein (UPF0127 family)
MIHRYSSLFTLAVLLLLSACAPKQQTKQPASADSYFPLTIGSNTVQLQLALTDSERAQGLMYRDSMPHDHGMLFLFNEPGPRSFWMRNTRIPLDLAYFDADGRLLEVHALYPYDENGVASRSDQVQIVVEMNRGWFARNQMQAAAKIDLDALAQAVKRRGKSPATYQLQTAP